jgi:hypothetical protein
MVLDPMEQFDNLANAHPQAMHGQQRASELPNGQTRYRSQVGNDTGKTHPDASVAQDLFLQVNWSLIPFPTACAPTPVDAMLGHFHWRGNRHIDHLPHAGQADASYAQMTARATHHSVLHDLGRLLSTPHAILLRLVLLARFLFLWPAHIRFEKGWWGRFLLF